MNEYERARINDLQNMNKQGLVEQNRLCKRIRELEAERDRYRRTLELLQSVNLVLGKESDLINKALRGE